MIAVLKAKNSPLAKGKLPDEFILEHYKIGPSRPLRPGFEQVSAKKIENLVETNAQLLKEFEAEKAQKSKELHAKREKEAQESKKKKEKVESDFEKEAEKLFSPEQWDFLKRWVDHRKHGP